MGLKQKLEDDLKSAMRTGDQIKKNTIRMALSAIKLCEVEKGNSLDDNAITAVLYKELKNVQESLDSAQIANRPDLIKQHQEELSIIESYLPTPLSEEEIVKLAKSVIEEVGAKNPSDLGKVMKVILPRLEGRARGDQVSRVLKQLLQGS